MLNGLDPIIIFLFFKKLPPTQEALDKLGLIDQAASYLTFPPIPLYLSEKLTGMYIQSETKTLDIQTTTDGLNTGDSPLFQQKGIGSTVTVELVANKDSIGLTVLSAMSDLIFTKLRSKEYSITYVHGPITIINGLLHSFSVNQTSEDDLLRITMELSRSGDKTNATKVPNNPGPTAIDGDGAVTGGTLPAASSDAVKGSAFTVKQPPVEVGRQL